MTTRIETMFIGQGPSGLAEDRVVNTFHFFRASDIIAGDLEAATGAVADFYTGVGTGANAQVRAISAYLSPWVSRTAEIRSYDLSTSPPRIPLITPVTLAAAGSADGLPEEVALVISLQGSPPVTPRRRGRLYFGPIISTASVDASSSTATRPSDAMTDDLCKAAARLAGLHATMPTPALNWAIRSSLPTENFVNIVGGYVDNAFDTQRRRGPAPTSRLTFVQIA